MNHKMMDLCRIHDTQKLWTCLLSDSKVDRQLWAHLCISWICHDFSWWYAVSRTTTITWLILFLRLSISLHRCYSQLLQDITLICAHRVHASKSVVQMLSWCCQVVLKVVYSLTHQWVASALPKKGKIGSSSAASATLHDAVDDKEYRCLTSKLWVKTSVVERAEQLQDLWREVASKNASGQGQLWRE
jgi:hypothetical protein